MLGSHDVTLLRFESRPNLATPGAVLGSRRLDWRNVLLEEHNHLVLQESSTDPILCRPRKWNRCKDRPQEVQLSPCDESCWALSLALDELLASVDVVRCSSDRRVRHEVDSQCGDIGRTNDAPDRQRRSQLFATRVQFVAEQRCR